MLKQVIIDTNADPDKLFAKAINARKAVTSRPSAASPLGFENCGRYPTHSNRFSGKCKSGSVLEALAIMVNYLDAEQDNSHHFQKGG